MIGFVIIFSYGMNNVAAADTSTLYVNSSGNDSWDGQLAVWNGTSGPKASIKNATESVDDGGTINIADGVYTGDQNTNIVIYKNMNIIGQSQDGTIINGTDVNGLFSIIPGYNVTISDLTMCNGYTVYGGAAINTTGGNLTVNNCNFEYNNASVGGAIFTRYISYLTINNCDFIGNNATIGGVIFNSGTLNVNNGTFTNNTASSSGGAIDNIGTLTVTGSNFTNNTSTTNNGYYGGGAIFNSGNLTVNNNTLTENNAAKTLGGAIYNSGNLIVNETILTDNNALAGGAIFNNGTLTFINNTSISNTADGGAIANSGAMMVSDSIFIANVYAIRNNINDTIEVTNCNFTGNNGAIYINQGTFNVNNCTFTNNYLPDDLGVSGGAIYNAPLGTLNVNNSTFTNNTANFNSDWGGAIENMGTLNVNNSTFTGNSASYGGAIDITGSQSIITINNSSFTNNNATDGGAIFNGYGNSIIQYNRMYGNTATNGNDIYNLGGTVNATLNWWGSDSGPLTADIYGDIITTPWLVITANASPNSGLYNTYQTVNLAMNVPGTIYYTLDGSDPTTSSSIYINPININTNTVLKYLAVDTTGDQSPVYIETYTIDTISPTANNNPSGGLYNTSKIVTLSMSEPGTIYYTLDGTIPTSASSAYTTPFAITSNTTLKYIAVDLAGNKSPVYSDVYTIDTIPPTASANLTGGLYNTTQNVTLTMSEPGTIYYTTDNTNPTTSSTPYTNPLTINKEGTTVLEFIAVDTAWKHL